MFPEWLKEIAKWIIEVSKVWGCIKVLEITLDFKKVFPVEYQNLIGLTPTLFFCLAILFYIYTLREINSQLKRLLRKRT